MTVTAKLYPSFLGDNSLDFSFQTQGFIDCKALLCQPVGGFVLGSAYSFDYEVNHFATFSIDDSFIVENSTKDIKLYYQRTGSDIKFWLEEVTWTDIPDGIMFDRIVVYKDPNLLAMWIGLDPSHTVDGPFKLRKTTGGEIKITFS